MIHPPKQDESQNHTRGNPSDSGFRRDALGLVYWTNAQECRTTKSAVIAMIVEMPTTLHTVFAIFRPFQVTHLPLSPMQATRQ
jgi:hypothetical protein